MRYQIEVTVPVKLEASLTFLVDDISEVTTDLIEAKLSEAQFEMDNGARVEGVYWCGIESAGEPHFYDPNEEMDAAATFRATMTDSCTP